MEDIDTITPSSIARIVFRRACASSRVPGAQRGLLNSRRHAWAVGAVGALVWGVGDGKFRQAFLNFQFHNLIAPLSIDMGIPGRQIIWSKHQNLRMPCR